MFWPVRVALLLTAPHLWLASFKYLLVSNFGGSLWFNFLICGIQIVSNSNSVRKIIMVIQLRSVPLDLPWWAIIPQRSIPLHQTTSSVLNSLTMHQSLPLQLLQPYISLKPFQLYISLRCFQGKIDTCQHHQNKRVHGIASLTTHCLSTFQARAWLTSQASMRNKQMF